MTPEEVADRIIIGTGRFRLPRGSRGSFPSMRKQRGFVGPTREPRPIVRPPPLKKPVPLRRGRPRIEPFPRPWEIKAPPIPEPLPQAKPPRPVIDEPLPIPEFPTFPRPVPPVPQFPEPVIAVPELPPQEVPTNVPKQITPRPIPGTQKSQAPAKSNPQELLQRILRRSVPGRLGRRTRSSPYATLSELVRPQLQIPRSPDLDLTPIEAPQLTSTPPRVPAATDPCRELTKRKRKEQRRTCAIRYNVAWTSGPQKGKLAGSRCFKWERFVKRKAVEAVREFF